jgi:hypothetical protein
VNQIPGGSDCAAFVSPSTSPGFGVGVVNIAANVNLNYSNLLPGALIHPIFGIAAGPVNSDGSLVASARSSLDYVWTFNVVPEPASLAILSLALILVRRHKTSA